MKAHRRKSRAVRIGSVAIGGRAPVSVQSMTKTDTRDVRGTVRQIHALEEAGCEIVRVAVPDREAAQVLDRIKKKVHIPVVADIHFNSELAIEAIRRGVDCIRLNPGNIYRPGEVKKVAGEAQKRNIPIRVGVNSGSVRGKSASGLAGARTMVRSALNYISLLEKLDFRDIIVSLKASDVPTTVRAYEIMAEKCPYPFHVGITAAGPQASGSIRSAVGIGALLSEGIGDTIRVSLTGDPREEVRVAYEILDSLGLRKRGPIIISCPTCGRCQVNLVKIVRGVEGQLGKLYPQDRLDGVKIAIMGCAVNGPGEAREADIGIACGRGKGILFRNGEIVKRMNESKLVRSLIAEVKKVRGLKSTT